MTLSEEDAKTKRCQESFAAATGISADGAIYPTTWQALPPNCAGASPAVHTAPSMCIASACMAWRWKYGDDRRFRGEDAKHGYCGKAGTP